MTFPLKIITKKSQLNKSRKSTSTTNIIIVRIVFIREKMVLLLSISHEQEYIVISKCICELHF